MKTLFSSIDVKDVLSGYKTLLGSEISVCGWVRTVRSSKDLSFIELNDGTCFDSLQIVCDNTVDSLREASKISVGSAIVASGVLRESLGAKQVVELQLSDIVLAGRSDADYPLQKKSHSLEYLREIAHLRCRTRTFSSMFRLRSMLSYAIHKFFQEEGFTYVNTPVITGNDCEGAGEMFKVTTLDINSGGKLDSSKDFFGQHTGLTVSGQLEAETMVAAFKKVYTFGPIFRAEKSNTRRHLAEFWMVEPEIAFAKLEDVIVIIEKTVKFLISHVLQNAAAEIKFFDQYWEKGLQARLENIVASQFGIITYTEAIEALIKSGKKFVYKPEWGIPLQTEHERYLADELFKKPVFVIDYPKDAKPFYMKLNSDGRTVAATDLLFPGIGEIIGSSEREDSYDIMLARMEELGLDPAEYQWYLDLRKYGSVPHSGFGIGFERFLMYLTGMENIRDTIPFPRTPGKIEF